MLQVRIEHKNKQERADSKVREVWSIGLLDWLKALFASNAAPQSSKKRRKREDEEEEELEELIAIDII